MCIRDSHYTYTLGIKDHPVSHSTGVIHPYRYNSCAVEMYPDSLSFYVNDVHTFTYPRIQTKEEEMCIRDRTSVTLGTKLDEKIIDDVLEHGKERFLLHYNFPPFSKICQKAGFDGVMTSTKKLWSYIE